MKRVISILIALCLCAFLLAGTAFADPPIARAETLKVGYFDYKGFIDKGEDGVYNGYAVDYLNRISNYVNYKYEYVHGDWDELLDMLAEGEIDLLCTAQYTPERAQIYDYTDNPIGYESAVLYVRPDDERYFYEDFESFNGMRVGRLLASYQNDIFDSYASEHGFAYTPVDYADINDAFDALTNSELDAVIMGSLNAQTDYKIVARFSSDAFYFITTKGNNTVINNLNYALNEISIDAPYYEATLYKRYYEDAFLNTKPAFTRDEASYISAAAPIHVGVMGGRFPLAAQDAETGEVYGIQIDAMNLISSLSGLTFEYEVLSPGQTGLEYLSQSPARLILGLMVSEFTTISPDIRLSDSFMTDTLCLVGRAGELIDDDAEFTFAMPLGYISGEGVLAARYPNAKFITYQNNDDCMRAILNGDADFMVQDYYIITERLQSPRFDGLSILSAYTYEQDACIGMLADEHPELISIINKCISRLDNRDITNSIASYTTGSPYRMTFTDFVYKYRLIIIIGMALLAALLGSMFAMIQLRRRNEKLLEAKNKQLNRAIIAAERANAAKSNFLSSMSHDIRTPMNVIINMTQLAIDEKDDPDAVQNYHEKIKFMGQYLLGLINNILDMSKIESGKMELHEEPFSYKMFVESMCNMIEPMCAEKNITFYIDKDTDYPTVMLDVTRFNQIIYNLLSNAVKYTPAGGEVSLRIENRIEKDGYVEWDNVISDNGIGMSEEFQKKMFEPFSQEHARERDYTTQLNGTGLGLSIAKSFTDLMGGTINVNSKPGKGTTFIVHVRCKLADIASDAAAAAGESEDISGMNVLLVEDHPLNAEIVKRLLTKKDASVTWEENGRLGVEAFKSSAPGTFDAILMDIRMPIMDGLAAARAIRALEREDAKAIPILAMTANAYESDKRASMGAGMNEHISKPISPHILYSMLSRYKNKEDMPASSSGDAVN